MSEPYEGRFGPAPDLRALSASGAVVNGVFHVSVALLALLRGFAVAALISPSDYGVWGLLGLAIWTATILRAAGVNEKYVQQSEGDQELAFQRAFTVELIFAAVAAGLLLVVVPAMAAITGETELLLPGLALGALLPATALQFPVWSFNRRMDFRTQRRLMALDPLVGTAVTIALAALGAGYWSFVGGLVAGAWAAALGALARSPHRLALRHDRGSLRTYLAYSWPLAVSALTVIVIFQAIYLTGSHALGLAALGAFTLAAQVLSFSDRLDAIVTETLFPAIVAVRDRTEVMFEAFAKSNRLTLLWAAPFGVGVSLFAADLVEFVLGRPWEPAVVVLQVMGVVSASRHVGANWHAFQRAGGDTRPIAVTAVVGGVALIAASVPLMYAHGLAGLAWGFAIGEAVNLVLRTVCLRRLFPGFRMTWHLLRALLPAALAAAAVVLFREAAGAERTAVLAAAELAAYVALVAGASLLAERALLREAAAMFTRRAVARA